MPFFVYLLLSAEGYHYTGQTPDLARRLAEHNSGLCHSTKHGTSWSVVHTEEFATRSEGMRREKFLKSRSGRRWIAQHVAGWSPAHPKGVTE